VTRIFLISDHHFGHSNIVHKFDPSRPFVNIHEHDEALVSNHNSVVRPEDHVYFLGDVVINRRMLPIVTRLNGKKRLVRGNHDIFKTKEYIDVGFEEIYGVRVFQPNTQQNKTGFILSHIPLHPDHLIRGYKNVHGHLHFNRVMRGPIPDDRYISVCCEHVNYTPVLLESLR